MAERRMFAKTIIDSDAFLDMPMSARLLYYDLSMRADDDGFVNSPRKIMKFVGASNDDMNILIARKFVITFDSGVVVIKHWRIHNYIRKDTYKETNYKEEKAMLKYDENNAYTLTGQVEMIPETTPSTSRQRSVDEPSTQDRIGKDRIGKVNKSRRFTPPTLEEVQAYVEERGNLIDAKKFFDYYETAGWKDSKGQPVKNWKQKAITWEGRGTQTPKSKLPDFENINGYHELEKKEPMMSPEEAKEWYDNLIKELEAEDGQN